MFRILIVEDIKETLFEIRDLLRQVFPNAVIDLARSIEEARGLLTAAHQEECPYHAVILDFKLPDHEGENPSVDETLCEYIRTFFPWTLIAHITSAPNDHKILRHQEMIHIKQNDRNAFFLSKLNPDDVKQLIGQMRTFLYSGLVEEQIDGIFGSKRDPSFTSRERLQKPSGGRGSSLTHRLASLRQDIVTYWRYLDISVKKKVQDIYQIDDSTDPIRIKLLRDEIENTGG